MHKYTLILVTIIAHFVRFVDTFNRHSKEAEGVELGLGLRREGRSDLGAELIAARWHRSKASKANVGR